MLFNREKDKKKADKALSLNLAYKRVFSSEDGKEVLKDLMVSTGYDNTTFVPGDPYNSAFNEGARSLVVRIVRSLNLNPESFMKIMEDIEDDKEVLDV